jgi:hypothetical protein
VALRGETEFAITRGAKKKSKADQECKNRKDKKTYWMRIKTDFKNCNIFSILLSLYIYDFAWEIVFENLLIHVGSIFRKQEYLLMDYCISP